MLCLLTNIEQCHTPTVGTHKQTGIYIPTNTLTCWCSMAVRYALCLLLRENGTQQLLLLYQSLSSLVKSGHVSHSAVFAWKQLLLHLISLTVVPLYEQQLLLIYKGLTTSTAQPGAAAAAISWGIWGSSSSLPQTGCWEEQLLCLCPSLPSLLLSFPLVALAQPPPPPLCLPPSLHV